MSSLACPPAASLEALYRHGRIVSVSSVYKTVRQCYAKIQFCYYAVVGGLSWGRVG